MAEAQWYSKQMWLEMYSILYKHRIMVRYAGISSNVLTEPPQLFCDECGSSPVQWLLRQRSHSLIAGFSDITFSDTDENIPAPPVRGNNSWLP